MNQIAATIGTTVHLNTGFEAALDRVITVLNAEGFGVLTEIDVRATMKEKLGVDFRPYRILGVCNPPLAHRALTLAPQVGLLLPCNVTVSEVEPGIIEVSLIDPLALLGVAAHPDLRPIADEARARLARVYSALQEK